MFGILVLLGICCSCVLDNSTDVLHNSTGTVCILTGESRGISASIDYPELHSLIWSLTAVKADNGETIGEGTTEDALLTDTFGPYSTGLWDFTLKGYDNGVLIYEGSARHTVLSGPNTIEIQVSPAGDGGTLSVEDCTLAQAFKGNATTVSYLVEDTKVNTVSFSLLELSDGVYSLPDKTVELEAGIHLFRLGVSNMSGEITYIQSVRFRILPNCVTHLTIGMHAGTGALEVTVLEQEPLVTE